LNSSSFAQTILKNTMRKLFLAFGVALSIVACDNSANNNEESTSDVTASGYVETLTSPSGVTINVMKKGDGAMLQQGDVVSVHYTGYLKATGDTFDTSIKRGQPIQFPIGTGRVIPGWDEAIMMLPVGTKALLDIPSGLAYGAQGNSSIPPNSDLMFEVEVVGAQPGPKPIVHEPWSTEGLKKFTTESGLEYYIIEEGSGQMVQPGKKLKVHYHGSLEDGTVFDNSYERGQPLEFVYMQQRMIPGWDEGLGLMTEGTKAKLVIPYTLAYGEAGRPPVIPEKATLIFDIQILEVL
jgi:peptidylprolyl isomerase